MKITGWKRLACKLLGLTGVLFLFGLLGAVVEGTFPWVLGLALGFLCLVVLNGICGVLLPEVCAQEPAAVPPVQPTLQVMQGGKVA